MKKKILIVSISAAVLVIVASFSSVIGLNTLTSPQNVGSPLFEIRTQRSIQTDDQQNVQSNYLGKGVTSNLFINKKPSLSTAIDKTIKLLYQNPAFFAKFLERIYSNPKVISLLQDYDISVAEFKSQLNHIKNDPSAYIEKIRSVESQLDATKINTPIPLSLNTTNPIGCVVTVIALLPIVLVVGMIVVLFTLRILQCLNLEQVMQDIFDNIIQELYPAWSDI